MTSPISDVVRAMAFSTFTCAWCGVNPMRGTAADVDGTMLPTCGTHTEEEDDDDDD